VLLGLFLATFAGFALFSENPLGGEPMTRIAIGPHHPAEEQPAMAPAASTEPGAKSTTITDNVARAKDGHHHRWLQRRAPRRDDIRRDAR